MNINRLKQLAGVPQQLNEVSDATVSNAIRARQKQNWEAQDRASITNQTPASAERNAAKAGEAKAKSFSMQDAAGKRLARRRRSAETMEAMRMAGILIDEAYGDDDDEDPDVKIANSDRRQKEFEKKNAPALKAAAKKVASADARAEEKGAKAAASEDDDKSEAKSEAKPEAKPEADKPATAAKAKGRAPTDRGVACRAWFKDHPGATRGQFVAHCTGLGMTVANANTTYYSIKKKSAATNEAFMIFHPLDSGTVLAENARMRRFEWISIAECTDYTEPLVFESEFEAQTIVDGVGLVSQAGVVIQTMKDGTPLEMI